ncbi:MAG: heme-binding domain-containing protein [Deltaproteobacteria bacterium]|nr:heme-binding domain-containing protein [Deltaproteobacteria bacterium]
MRALVVLLSLLVVVGIGLPVANLARGPIRPPATRPVDNQDPTERQTAALLYRKCGACHSTADDPALDLRLPVLRQVEGGDRDVARRAFDLGKAFATPVLTQPSPAAPAKLEAAIVRGTMPPAAYRLLHWDSGVNAAERALILEALRR